MNATHAKTKKFLLRHNGGLFSILRYLVFNEHSDSVRTSDSSVYKKKKQIPTFPSNYITSRILLQNKCVDNL